MTVISVVCGGVSGRPSRPASLEKCEEVKPWPDPLLRCERAGWRCVDAYVVYVHTCHALCSVKLIEMMDDVEIEIDLTFDLFNLISMDSASAYFGIS
jgi:hypothetical protein